MATTLSINEEISADPNSEEMQTVGGTVAEQPAKKPQEAGEKRWSFSIPGIQESPKENEEARKRRLELQRFQIENQKQYLKLFQSPEAIREAIPEEERGRWDLNMSTSVKPTEDAAKYVVMTYFANEFGADTELMARNWKLAKREFLKKSGMQERDIGDVELYNLIGNELRAQKQDEDTAANAVMGLMDYARAGASFEEAWVRSGADAAEYSSRSADKIRSATYASAKGVYQAMSNIPRDVLDLAGEIHEALKVRTGTEAKKYANSHNFSPAAYYLGPQNSFSPDRSIRESPRGIGVLAERLADLPEDKYKQVMASLYAMAKTRQKKEKGFLQQTAETAGRRGEDIVRWNMNLVDSMSLATLQDDIAFVEELGRMNKEHGAVDMTAGRAVKMASLRMRRGKDFSLESLKNEEARMKRLNAIEQDLINIERGLVDPVIATNWFMENMWYPAVSNVMTTLPAFIPGVGMPMIWNMIRGQRLEELREQDGMSENDALLISAFSATVETPIEMLQARLLIGKMPVFDRFLNMPASSLKKVALRFFTAAGVNFGEQYTQERLQDATPLVTQEALSILKETVPDVPWELWEKYEGEDWATANSLVLIALGGAAVNVRGNLDYRNNAQSLVRDHGFTEQQANEVLGQPTLEQAEGRAEQIWINNELRNPDSDLRQQIREETMLGNQQIQDKNLYQIIQGRNGRLEVVTPYGKVAGSFDTLVEAISYKRYLDQGILDTMQSSPEATQRAEAIASDWMGSAGVVTPGEISTEGKAVNQAQSQAESIVSTAQMPREVRNFTEAREALADVLGQPITNASDGAVAVVSGQSLKKMLSKSEVSKSISPQVHTAAVANIDYLYENSVLGETHEDRKGGGLESVHRYVAPMIYDGAVYGVKITVKEQKNKQGNIVYTVEAIDVENMNSSDNAKSGGERMTGESTDAQTPYISEELANTLSEVVGNVKSAMESMGIQPKAINREQIQREAAQKKRIREENRAIRKSKREGIGPDGRRDYSSARSELLEQWANEGDERAVNEIIRREEMGALDNEKAMGESLMDAVTRIGLPTLERADKQGMRAEFEGLREDLPKLKPGQRRWFRLDEQESAILQRYREAGFNMETLDDLVEMVRMATRGEDIRGYAGTDFHSPLNQSQPNPPATNFDALPGIARGRGVNAPKTIEAMADIVKVLGAPGGIRVGKFGRRKALGVYSRQTKLAQIRTDNDVGTAAHELAHAFEDALWGMGRRWRVGDGLSKAAIDEMTSLGQELYGNTVPNGGYRSEGFAEYMRLFLTDPEQAGTKAPLFNGFFETQVLDKNPSLKAAVLKAQEMGTMWFRQGALERARQQIAPRPTILGRARRLDRTRLRQEFEKKFIESAVYLRDFVREAQERADSAIPDELNPFVTLTTRRMTADSKADYMANKAMIDYWGRVTGKPLKDAFGLVGKKSVNDFILYLWAKRAIALWYDPRGARNPGINKADAEYIFSQLDSPKFAQAAQMVYDWNNGVLEYAAQASPSYKETVGKIRERDPGSYIPLFREFNAIDERYSGRGGVKGKDLIKRLHGSGKRIKNPVESMVLQAKQIILKADQTRVLEQAIDLAEQAPGMGHLIRQVTRDMIPTLQTDVKAALDKINAVLKDHGGRVEIDPGNANFDDIAAETLTFFTQAVMPKNGEFGYIPLYRNGSIQWFEISKGLYETLASMDAQPAGVAAMPVLGKILQVHARTMRLGTTGLRASFSLVTNPLRDFRTLYYNTRAGKNGLVVFSNWIGSMFTLAVNAPFEAIGRNGIIDNVYSRYKDQFDRMGLEMSGSLTQDSPILSRASKRVMRGGKVSWESFGPTNIYSAMLKLFQFPESAARIAEMKMVGESMGWDINQPMTPRVYAALADSAKTVTTDFTRAGTAARQWNYIVPFFNAGLQGKLAHWEAFKRNPVRWLFTRGLVISALAIANWWRNKDEEWWLEMPDRERLAYDYVQIGDEIVRLPRAFDIDNIFMGGTTAILDAWYANEPERVKEWFKDTAIDFIPNPVPPSVKLAFELSANYNTFSGRNIVPRGEIDRAPEEQYNEYTSRAAIEIGDIFGVSPRKVDHSIRSIFGGVGSDIAYLGGRGDEFVGSPTDRESEPNDFPILGVLFKRGGTNANNPVSVEKLYDIYDKVRERNRSIRKDETQKERLERLAVEDAIKAVQAYSELSRLTTSRRDRNEINSARNKLARDAVQAFEAGSIANQRGEFKSHQVNAEQKTRKLKNENK